MPDSRVEDLSVDLGELFITCFPAAVLDFIEEATLAL